MRRWAWILALMAAFAATSHAQLPRPLPANGKLGELYGQQQQFPLLQIGDKVLRLAPGGRIFDEHNRIVMHAYLPAQAAVLFVEDMHGDISRLYLLRPDELEALKRAR